MNADALPSCALAASIPPWVAWAYWLDPLTYAIRALALSEFTAPRWQRPAPGQPGLSLGMAILRANGLDHPKWWIGACVGILMGYVVVLNVACSLALRYLNGGWHAVEKANHTGHHPLAECLACIIRICLEIM